MRKICHLSLFLFFLNSACIASGYFSSGVSGGLSSTGTGLVENFGAIIQTPAAATVPMGVVDFAGTVTAARTKCEAGSLTANFQICTSGGSCTSITGCSAVSVTTSTASTTCTAAASVSAGNYLQVVITSPSSASYCQLGVKFTRS